jgi:hypothetical protein
LPRALILFSFSSGSFCSNFSPPIIPPS